MHSIPSVSRQTWHPVIIFSPSGYTLQQSCYIDTLTAFYLEVDQASELASSVGIGVPGCIRKVFLPEL